MRTVLLAIIGLFFLPVAAEDITGNPASVIHADIDCDGITDSARLTYIESHVRLTVTLGKDKATQVLEFGLGDSMAQDALCGTEATLEIEDLDYDLTEIFGEPVEGFEPSTTCKGLRLAAGECDSMHIFWNHQSHHIDWWRL